jgi:hypothetical protein
VCCHWKSQLLSLPGHQPQTTSFTPADEDQRGRYGAYALCRRADEAATVRCYVDRTLDGHGADRALVALSGMNHDAAAATTQMLLRPPGSQIGTGGFGHADIDDRRSSSRILVTCPLCRWSCFAVATQIETSPNSAAAALPDLALALVSRALQGRSLTWTACLSQRQSRSRETLGPGSQTG